MARITLCSGPVEVILMGAGEDMILNVKDGSEVCYRVKTSWLEEVLSGETIQISGHGRHCKLQPNGSVVRFSYSADGHHHSCEMSAEELRNALTKIKAEESSNANA
jgi:hypothetical protein